MANASHLKLVTSGNDAPPARIDAAADATIDKVAARESAAAADKLRAALAYVTPLYEGRQLPQGEAIMPHVLGAVSLVDELRLGHEAAAAALLWPALTLAEGAARRVRDKFGVAITDLAEGVLRMSAMGALGTHGTHGTHSGGAKIGRAHV